jgi:hypothetical protein
MQQLRFWFLLTRTFARENTYNQATDTDKESNATTLERLGEQSGLLLRTYQAEFAKNPTSRATESSRSNLIALLHTINQIYGAAISLIVTDALGLSLPADIPQA